MVGIAGIFHSYVFLFYPLLGVRAKGIGNGPIICVFRVVASDVQLVLLQSLGAVFQWILS